MLEIDRRLRLCGDLNLAETAVLTCRNFDTSADITELDRIRQQVGEYSGEFGREHWRSSNIGRNIVDERDVLLFDPGFEE